MFSIPSTTLLLLLVIFIASLSTSNAFVPQSTILQQSSSSLNVGLSFDEEPQHLDQYHQLLQRANDCTKSEECSLEEWESVVTEMEYINDMETEELSHLVQGIHQLEERSALSTWTNSRNLPIVVTMFLFSTLNTLSQDDIVTRIGWFLQDWNQVATQSSWHSTQLPLFMCAAAAYVAVSEVASGFLPQNE